MSTRHVENKVYSDLTGTLMKIAWGMFFVLSALFWWAWTEGWGGMSGWNNASAIPCGLVHISLFAGLVMFHRYAMSEEEPEQHVRTRQEQPRQEEGEAPALTFKEKLVRGFWIAVALLSWVEVFSLKGISYWIFLIPVALSVIALVKVLSPGKYDGEDESKDLEVPWEQPKYRARPSAKADVEPEQTDWGKVAMVAVLAIVTPTTFVATSLAIMSKIGWWIIPLVFVFMLLFTLVAAWMHIMGARFKRTMITIVVVLGVATGAILLITGKEVIPPLIQRVQTALAIKNALQPNNPSETGTQTVTPVPTATGTPSPTPHVRATQIAGIHAAESELGLMIETVGGNTNRVIGAVETLESEKTQKPENGILGTWSSMVTDEGGFDRASKQVGAWFNEGVMAVDENGEEVWIPMPFPQRVIEHSTAGNLSSEDAVHLNLGGFDLVNAQEALKQFVRHLATHTKEDGEINDAAWIATANSLKDDYNGGVNSFNQHASHLALQGRLILLPGDIVDRIVSCSRGTPIEVTPTPDAAATAVAMTRQAPAPTKATEPTPIPTSTPIPTAAPTNTPEPTATPSRGFPTVRIQTPTPTSAMPTTLPLMQWGTPTSTVGPGTPTPEPDYCTPAPPTN